LLRAFFGVTRRVEELFLVTGKPSYWKVDAGLNCLLMACGSEVSLADQQIIIGKIMME
jgi:hypothetical protein